MPVPRLAVRAVIVEEGRLLLVNAFADPAGTLWCAPGNPGIAEVAECVVLDIGDHGKVIDFCRVNGVTLVVVGPEAPLVDGLADSLTDAGIAVNPAREELADRLRTAQLPLLSIEDLATHAARAAERAVPLRSTGRVIAVSEYRDGTVTDVIREMVE